MTNFGIASSPFNFEVVIKWRICESDLHRLVYPSDYNTAHAKDLKLEPDPRPVHMRKLLAESASAAHPSDSEYMRAGSVSNSPPQAVSQGLEYQMG